jgi:CRP-like cAMP-binding protein
LKKLKKKDLVVGIIEGGHGQVFGEEEIINNENRVYSVRCMSTRNLVIKIHREYFNHILKGDPKRMIKI